MNRYLHWVRDAVRLHSVTHKLRSPQWPEVRHKFLELNGACAACGGTTKLQVHHKKPFHLFPELELDPKNFITLCEQKVAGDHHLNVGHKGDWKNFNPTVVEDAAALLKNKH